MREPRIPTEVLGGIPLSLHFAPPCFPRIEVVDEHGKRVHYFEIDDVDQEHIEDMPDLPPGLYTVHPVDWKATLAKLRVR